MTVSPSEYLKSLESKKPLDLNTSNPILTETPHPLFLHIPFTLQEQQSYDERSINYIITKFKKESKWNVEVDDSKTGEFDAENNFILKTEKKNEEEKFVLWMINELAEGPFTTDEMVLKCEIGELEGRSVKRVDDEEFCCVDRIVELEDSFKDYRLDEVFKKLSEVKIEQKKNEGVKEAAIEEKKVKSDTVDIVSKNVTKERLTQREKNLLMHSCPGSTVFLGKYDCGLSLVDLVEILKGKDRKEGVSYLKSISKMGETECTEFIEMVIKESKIGICKMDCDGFEKVGKISKKK